MSQRMLRTEMRADGLSYNPASEKNSFTHRSGKSLDLFNIGACHL